MRDANEITFGIEIESIVPVGSVNVGRYSRPNAAPAGIPAGWATKTDHSIRAPNGYRGCEWVSPVLKGADGLRQIVQVCEQLQRMGVKVNRSTGLHVHVGFDVRNTKALRNLMHLTSHHQTAIYATTGTLTRESDRWCKSIKQSFRDVAKNPTLDAMRRDGYRSVGDRYHVLNVSNLLGRRPTVEFRAFAGTINATKIIGYVRLCVALVQKAEATKRRPNWDAKNHVATSPIARKSGSGATALTRLFYALGWTKGRQARTFGDIATPHYVPALPTIKKELSRLARKYDRAKVVA